MADRFEKTCPHCGSHLMLREGMYGDFLACPRYPACKYTESLPKDAFDENNILTLKEYQPPKPYCEKCNHTGLLPFEKNGMVYSHVFIDCDCKENEREHYQPVSPEDIDFPVSWDWHRHYSNYHGWPEPVNNQIPEPKEEPQVIFKPRPVHQELDQLKGMLVHYERKLNEHIDLKKPKKKASDYRGLSV